MNHLANIFKSTYLSEETVNNSNNTKKKEKENQNPQNQTINKQPTRRRCPDENEEFPKRVVRKPTKHNYSISLFNYTQKQYLQFPCFNEEEFVPEKFQKFTIERKQDDDCQSDDEVLKQSQNYLYQELLDALSVENKRRYSRKI